MFLMQPSRLRFMKTNALNLRVIKSRIMRWAGHVARMGEEMGCIGSRWENMRERTTGET